MKPWDLAVIGGGAAGLSGAITAARGGLRVCVIDHMDRVGKKILSTGNGRCNFTNEVLTPDCYYTQAPRQLKEYLAAHPTSEVLTFMESLGIPSVNRDGYYYPASLQAASVLECMLAECQHLGIHFSLQQEVESVKQKDSLFSIRLRNGDRIEASHVLLSCGGKSAAHSGSDGSGYELAQQLGHHCKTVFPALVPLQIEKKQYQSLAGTRCQVQADLYVDQNRIRRERGELQWTEGALSGIVIFQLSHPAIEALYRKKKVSIVLNFMPEQSEKECLEMLRGRQQTIGYKEVYDWGIGLLPKKLWEFLVRESGLPIHKKAEEMSGKELAALQRRLQSLTVPILGALGYDRAQVTAGGIDLEEIRTDTMESSKVPGLYLAGEMLDVDGICGGYNLHWAITGGITAGKSVIQAENDKHDKQSQKIRTKL